LRLDASGLDDRPTILGLGFLEGMQGLRHPLFRRINSLRQIEQALVDCGSASVALAAALSLSTTVWASLALMPCAKMRPSTSVGPLPHKLNHGSVIVAILFAPIARCRIAAPKMLCVASPLVMPRS
jgi:hypothetical protein